MNESFNILKALESGGYMVLIVKLNICEPEGRKYVADKFTC